MVRAARRTVRVARPDPATSPTPAAGSHAWTAEHQQVGVQELADDLVGPRPHERDLDGHAGAGSLDQGAGITEEVAAAVHGFGPADAALAERQRHTVQHGQ